MVMQLSLPQELSKLAHAYILESVDDIAAEQLLAQLAQILLCQNNDGQLQQACQSCHSCSLFNAHNHPDFFINDVEQNSIGVDEVRQVSEFLTKTSQLSGNQVVILHNAEKMTENASNALLKTLEEPTAKSYILLSCQSKSQLLPTILSRCQFLTLPKKSKEQLQQTYNQVPDYLIGFSKGAESKLIKWQEDQESLESFALIYQSFIRWLKHSAADFELIESAATPELAEFLLYLLERRVYQLSVKQQVNAWSARQLISNYQTGTQKVQGINQKLALAKLVAELRSLL